jgi:hypothetical protein
MPGSVDCIRTVHIRSRASQNIGIPVSGRPTRFLLFTAPLRFCHQLGAAARRPYTLPISRSDKVLDPVLLIPDHPPPEIAARHAILIDTMKSSNLSCWTGL